MWWNSTKIYLLEEILRLCHASGNCTARRSVQSKLEKLKCDVKWSTNGEGMIVLQGRAALLLQGLVVFAVFA